MSRFHALTIADIRRETPDSVSIRFAVPEALKADFAFQPGQYLTLRAMIDGEDIRRSYSICSGLAEGTLRVGIKRVAGGAFSTYAKENLKPGDRLDVMPPDGRFTPKLDRPGLHTLGIAAGSGITPILSIAKTLLARDDAARFTLVYGNQTSQSVMFAEEIEDLKNRHLGRFTVVHILSREAQDVPVLSGRITEARLTDLANGILDLKTVDEAFLCGPEGMVAEAKSALAALGVPAEHIRSELFTASAPRKSYTPRTQAEARTVIAEINVTLDGKGHRFEMQASDTNILDAAARAGIDLPYSCKGGMCCTCRCKVEAGAVEMAVNYSLEPWETEAGFVLACQASPKTSEVALDFDVM
jgi:ring-1,2-phenylacetyl-CoA epoxidase subunit PaaE